MSFGLSRGRILDTTGIGRTADDLPPHDDGPIDLRTWFGESRCTLPLEIEIGSGKGTFLVQQAGNQPEVNFLGIEWSGEFYRYAADRLRRNALPNVQMLHIDAVEFLAHRVVDSVCGVIHLYFPDPWPKKRHHKRRSVQDASLATFHRVLQPGGEIRIVTDHEDYWVWIEDHAARNTALFTREAFERPTSAAEGEVVGTNFERKYRREGRPFQAMVLRRVDG